SIPALHEEGVGIVAIGQQHAASGDALRPEATCELLRGLLAAAVGVDIEGEINGAWTIAQLLKLAGIQMRAERAREVAKTCQFQQLCDRPRTVYLTFDVDANGSGQQASQQL